MNAVLVSKCQVPIFKTEPNDYHCSKEGVHVTAEYVFFLGQVLPAFLDKT